MQTPPSLAGFAAHVVVRGGLTNPHLLVDIAGKIHVKFQSFSLGIRGQNFVVVFSLLRGLAYYVSGIPCDPFRVRRSD